MQVKSSRFNYNIGHEYIIQKISILVTYCRIAVKPSSKFVKTKMKHECISVLKITVPLMLWSEYEVIVNIIKY